MIECLVKCDDEEFLIHKDHFEKAIRPTLPHTLGPGKWTIDIGDDRFIDFSPEFSGIQVSFDEKIEREIAELIIADVASNLTSLTSSSFHVVWLS
ncbi:hypothetical protein [Desulfogranum japonicum]|uniref:hypothetical protein n=1 Tax=Desulfogranum japonicum TaxID=231447 RepID=UPI000426E0C5|nr:hypothetical protein [Desulfogranum japonicum]